jgi:hypothetical protein
LLFRIAKFWALFLDLFGSLLPAGFGRRLSVIGGWARLLAVAVFKFEVLPVEARFFRCFIYWGLVLGNEGTLYFDLSIAHWTSFINCWDFRSSSDFRSICDLRSI